MSEEVAPRDVPSGGLGDSGDELGSAHRKRRQEKTFRKILAAGVDTLRASSYAELTMRTVAAQAKVAPATAYSYFASKNHLFAEIYLDLINQVPVFDNDNDPALTRVTKTLRMLTLIVADEPEVAAACTTALISDRDPAVQEVADRIGVAIHRRISAALGADAEPRRVAGLELVFYGALVRAATGYLSYQKIADQLTFVVSNMIDDL